jgi:hypothetical protein
VIASVDRGFSQAFTDLDFENPTWVCDPSVPVPNVGFVTPSSAMPGWTAYSDGNPYPDMLYDTIALAGGFVSLYDNNSWPSLQLQGDYYLRLMGVNYPGNETTTGVGQTGQIPPSARSLTFLADFFGGPDQVSFAGNTLSVNVIATTPNYDVYQADISQYAGNTGELLFTTSLGGVMTLDNIQFSTSPVPEPNSSAFFALGGLLVGLRHWRNASR